MSLFKRIFFGISELIPTNWLNQLSPVPVLLPYHHLVSDDYVPHIKGLYDYKNRKQFIQDLDWLLKYRKPVHPHELSDCLKNGNDWPQNSFLLTFDDGLREVYDTIAPILLEKGIPALFFLNPYFLDNKIFFYRFKLSLVIEKLKTDMDQAQLKSISDYLNTPSSDPAQIRKEILKIHYPDRHKADELGKLAEIDFDHYVTNSKPFMSSDQVRQLHDKGFSFGAHSLDHPHFAMISQQEQIHQTLESIKLVQDLAPGRFSYFSFPHEDEQIENEYFNALKKHSLYKDLLLFGTQNQLTERNNNMLHRFNAENPCRTVSQSAKSVLFYTALKSISNKNQVKRH